MTQSNPSSTFFEVLDIVKTEFVINDAYLEEGIPTFIVATTPNFKVKIHNLRTKIKSLGFEIVVRSTEASIKLMVLAITPAPLPNKRFFGLSFPLILFISTIISVAISGYLISTSYLEILKMVKLDVGNETLFLLGQTTLYTISIMCIVGLHELGHALACRINQVEASVPIFIPGIPGITPGTFGAIILQKNQPRNRDQLFDMGFSGPLVGFITSLIISAVGYSLSLPVSQVEYARISSQLGSAEFVYLPLIFRLLEPYLMPNPNSYTHFLHPLALAGWVGTLITFLNVFPIGQLDGGHVARSVLGKKWYRIFAYLGTGIMLLSGWWTMALLVIFFTRFEHPSTLDDISPLSKNRKVLALALVVIFVACFTVSPDSILTSL